MTVTTFYLIDSRLKGQRSVEVQVQFYRISSKRREREPALVKFIALTANYDRARPIEIELSDGLWGLDFVSYIGNKVGYTIRIPSENNAHQIDAAVLEGAVLPQRSRPLSYSVIEHDAFNEKLPRKFVASRANASFIGADALRNSRNHLANKLKVSATVIEFCGRPATLNNRRPMQFPLEESFEHRLGYWMQNWDTVNDETDVEVEVETIPGQELHIGKFQVLVGNNHNRKTILKVIFSDERYFLFVPHLGLRTGKKPRFIDIEIDFFDLPKTSTHGRISQVRVLTDNPAFNGVIQLLSTGRLYSANALWKRSAQDVLRDKFSDPIAAAAGALVLVQPEISSTIEKLRLEQIWNWLNNLDSRFQWISEGPICLAWMLGAVINADIIRVEGNKELKLKISELMIDAIYRGAPLYSEGLNLLSRAVDWASSEIDDELRVAVRWLALHSVNAGPFLLLRDQMR